MISRGRACLIYPFALLLHSPLLFPSEFWDIFTCSTSPDDSHRIFVKFSKYFGKMANEKKNIEIMDMDRIDELNSCRWNR